MDTITKAESTPAKNYPSTREIGRPAPSKSSGNFILDSKTRETSMPHRICTFDEMSLDEAVRQPMELTQTLTHLAIYNGSYVPGPSKSSASVAAAKFLNYNIRNMSTGTWFVAASDMVSSFKYGFSFLHPVMERRAYGDYRGDLVLRKLAPRSQRSLYGWLWDDKGREVQGIVQKPLVNGAVLSISDYAGRVIVGNNSMTTLDTNTYSVIKNNKLLRFTHNETNNNPQGNPELLSCYESWAEKQIIEQYEVIGVSKDLGGLVVVRVPEELLSGAADPTCPTYEADLKAYTNLETQVANIHAGKQSFIFLADTMTGDAKQWSYDIKLLGIEGNGKQYKTSEIIEQKRKDLYNCWGCGYLLLGQDSHGSYNLSSNGRIVHSFMVERNTAEIASVLSNDLAVKILSANQVYLSHEDMPIFKPADPDQLSFDEGGKFVQRVASTGKLTPEALTYLSELMGIPTDGIEDLDFTNKGDSRAGEGQGASGTGNSQNGGASSATNTENKSATKNYYLDPGFESDDQVVAVDGVTGEHIYINKEAQ